MNRWDEYFLKVATAVASNSKCLSRQLGAVIVRDNIIVSTGYNGPPKGVRHCDIRFKSKQCPRKEIGAKSGERLDMCIAGHAEGNAIASAAYLGARTAQAIMYCSWIVPCKECMIDIINAGIIEVVVTEVVYYHEISKILARESGVAVRPYGVSRFANI